MPVGAFSTDRLNSLLGKNLSSEKLIDALEKLGCDVDGTDQLVLERCSGCGILLERFEEAPPTKKCKECGHESEEPFPEVEKKEVIRLDLLADRPDLLDVAGLCRALKGYLGIETGLPEYKVKPSKVEVVVDKNKPPYRPVIQCAIVRISVDIEILREIIRLQESLHWALGRDRKLSSIGVYDLDTLVPPFRYSSVDPGKFKFCPLGMPGKEMTPKEILEKHPKGVGYAHLLNKEKKYPLLMDSKGQVLSMPPIINSDETKVKEGAKNLFVDVTGTDEKPVRDTLNSLLCSLVELGAQVESVKMVEGKISSITPVLKPSQIKVDYERAQSWIGKDFSEKDFGAYLEKMRLKGSGKSQKVSVAYPPYRSDIKHEVDVFEDIAIAIGYENLTPRLVSTMTVGAEREEEKLSNLVRQVFTGLGYIEIMSLMQTTQEKHFDFLGLTPEKDHVVIGNPKTVGQNIVRCHLLTGILEVFQKNRLAPKPQKFFETGNVVFIDKKTETQTREERRVVFAVQDKDAGYADVRALTDALLREMNLKGEYSVLEYTPFIPGRSAAVKTGSLRGILGEIHPKVLNHFEIPYPVALGEVTLMDLEF